MIEVNERGTEAAAVTLATGDRIIEDPPIPFIANKPFMFFIYHIRAKSVLFWGRVTRPQWT
jgi:serpin B